MKDDNSPEAKGVASGKSRLQGIEEFTKSAPFK